MEAIVKTKGTAVLACVALLALTVSCNRGGTADEALNSNLRLPFQSQVDGQTKWGYMDGTGKVVIQPQFLGADFFADGRARVQANNNSKGCVCWGYIDETGKMVIEPQFQGGEYMFSRSDNFADGLAVATYYNASGGGKRVVIDKNGQVVFNVPEGTSINDQFSEGLVVISAGSPMHFGFMDKTGKTVIEPLDFWGAYGFQEGLAIVANVDNKYGFIDQTGKKVVKEQFDSARSFSEGLAAVKISDKWGFIDKTGQMVIAPQFSNAGDFSEGLASVETGDFSERKFFVIDKSGKTVFALPKPKDYYTFRHAKFSEGLLWFENDVVDKSGKTVFTYSPPPIADLYKMGFKGGVAIITNGKSQAIYVDKTGKEITRKL